MALKDEIRARREALGMAQYDLAYALVVSPSTVYKWETGRSKPNFRKVLAMAKIFGVNEQELLNPKGKNEDSKNVL
ncbi:MAG: helix-turn-helix transcriptional regulator [Synergistaceae bacterium]|nr:helix-turn-helix transcriptional regulator [Synergistaceae bacterium]